MRYIPQVQRHYQISGELGCCPKPTWTYLLHIDIIPQITGLPRCSVAIQCPFLQKRLRICCPPLLIGSLKENIWYNDCTHFQKEGYHCGLWAVVWLVQQWLSPNRKGKNATGIQSTRLNILARLLSILESWKSRSLYQWRNVSTARQIDEFDKESDGKQARSLLFFYLGCH